MCLSLPPHPGLFINQPRTPTANANPKMVSHTAVYWTAPHCTNMRPSLGRRNTKHLYPALELLSLPHHAPRVAIKIHFTAVYCQYLNNIKKPSSANARSRLLNARFNDLFIVQTTPGRNNFRPSGQRGHVLHFDLISIDRKTRERLIKTCFVRTTRTPGRDNIVCSALSKSLNGPKHDRRFD